MSKSLDPLKETAQDLHRFWFTIATEQQWYAIMKECREWFGKKWKTQSKVRRKFNFDYSRKNFVQDIWFEVPDLRFATWISVKYGIQAQSDAKRQSGK